MNRFSLILGIVVGGVLTLGPLWGLLATVVGMQHAFSSLAAEGIQDPKALSGAVGETLVSTSLGFLVCPLGIALLVTCIVLLVKDKKQPSPIPSTSVLPPSIPLS